MARDPSPARGLVLTRRVGEKILLSDSSGPIGEIEVVSTCRDGAQLRLNFPSDIAIVRSELSAAARTLLTNGFGPPEQE